MKPWLEDGVHEVDQNPPNKFGSRTRLSSVSEVKGLSAAT